MEIESFWRLSSIFRLLNRREDTLKDHNDTLSELLALSRVPMVLYVHQKSFREVRLPINSIKEKKELSTYHVDGGHFSPHFIDSPEQSIIILPMIRSVQEGGGNTIVLEKSNIYFAQQLHREEVGIPKNQTQNLSHIAHFWPDELIKEIAPCDVGDILLMHPFLIHSAGQTSKGHPIRIAFNMGVRWKRKPVVPIVENEDSNNNGNSSWLEQSVSWCLNQSTKSFLKDTD